MNDRLLTTDEAAEYLTVQERTLRSIRQRGEIACVRIGHKRGKIAYRMSDLDAYVEERIQEPRRRRRIRKRS